MNNRYNWKERSGVSFFENFISENLNWVVRELSTSDIGIDCQIECIDPLRQPNGFFIGVQIKSGLGNVYETKDYFTKYVSKQHYYYWLKVTMPMIIVLYDYEERKLFWERINSKTLLKSKNGYKINIPKLNILDKSNESLDKFKSLNTTFSDINYLINNNEAAKIILKNAISLDQENTDALNQYALILTENCFYKESMSILNKAYKIDFKNANKQITEKTITRKLNFANNTLLLGKIKITKSLLTNCIKEAQRELRTSSYIHSVILNFSAQLNKHQGEIDKAIKLGKKALIHSKEHNHHYEEMISLSNLSEYYIEKSLLSKSKLKYLNIAKDYQFDALKLYLQNKNRFIDRIDIILSKIGVIYYYLQDFHRSLSYYLDSLEIQKEKFGEENIRIANRYNNIANCYGKLAKFNDAISLNEKAIKINLKIYKTENHYEIGNLYFTKGLLYFKIGKFKEGKEYLRKWNNIMNNINYPLSKFLPSLNLALNECKQEFKIVI